MSETQDWFKRASLHATLTLDNTNKESVTTKTPLSTLTGQYRVTDVEFKKPSEGQGGTTLIDHRRSFKQGLEGNDLDLDFSRVIVHHGNNRQDGTGSAENATDIIFRQAPGANIGDWGVWAGQDYTSPYQIIEADIELDAASRQTLQDNHNKWCLDGLSAGSPEAARLAATQQYKTVSIAGREHCPQVQDWLGVVNYKEGWEKSGFLTIVRNPEFNDADGKLRMTAEFESFINTNKEVDEDTYDSLLRGLSH